MWLGAFPKITHRHGQEWIWADDSAGFGRWFSRKTGSVSYTRLGGSEMCIRDSDRAVLQPLRWPVRRSSIHLRQW